VPCERSKERIMMPEKQICKANRIRKKTANPLLMDEGTKTGRSNTTHNFFPPQIQSFVQTTIKVRYSVYVARPTISTTLASPRPSVTRLCFVFSWRGGVLRECSRFMHYERTLLRKKVRRDKIQNALLNVSIWSTGSDDAAIRSVIFVVQ